MASWSENPRVLETGSGERAVMGTRRHDSIIHDISLDAVYVRESHCRRVGVDMTRAEFTS